MTVPKPLKPILLALALAIVAALGALANQYLGTATPATQEQPASAPAPEASPSPVVPAPVPPAVEPATAPQAPPPVAPTSKPVTGELGVTQWDGVPAEPQPTPQSAPDPHGATVTP